jgi:hypothetical protein
MDTDFVNALGEISVINQSGVDDVAISPTLRELSRKLSSWTNETRARSGRSSLFNPSKYAASDNPYEQMRTARGAVGDDDIISAAAELTEGLILQEVHWESSNEDLADVFNQHNATINLDNYLRVLYRELFTYSQSVSAAWWGWRSYLPRSRKKGSPKRKPITLWVPTQIITLDPLKCVPVGMSIFGEDRMAWNAAKDEMSIFTGDAELTFDSVMTELFLGRYAPSETEQGELTHLGVNPASLLEFNPDRVWRHCVTKSSFERFADVRLRSTFRLLDMKQQLMESDRVNLVGAANYILLVRQGTDVQPGTTEELSNLKENFKVIARLPVIVADHRLQIDIITPKVDYTLQPDRYNLLDERIAAKALNLLRVTMGKEQSQVTSRMIARGLENRRQMMSRMVEDKIRDAIWAHPRNAAVLASFKPDEKPALAFTPRHVQLDSDALMIAAITTARQSEEISRPSFLEWLGFDEDIEAQRRVRSAELYPTWKQAVPFNSPANGPAKDALPNSGDGSGGVPPAVTGAQGGRPAGGGTSKTSAQGAMKPRTATGAPSTAKQ